MVYTPYKVPSSTLKVLLAVTHETPYAKLLESPYTKLDDGRIRCQYYLQLGNARPDVIGINLQPYVRRFVCKELREKYKGSDDKLDVEKMIEVMDFHAANCKH